MGIILHVTLQPAEAVQGLGQEITGLNLVIEVENPELIRTGTEVIVSIHLTVNKLQQEVVIAQSISLENMVENRLPIEGSIWVQGTPDEIMIESHSVELFYIPA